jgi:hypothetical protein
MMIMKTWMAAAAAASVVWVADPAMATSAPSKKDLTAVVKAFLADHGDLCLAWYDWPRDLTAEDQQSGINEAVQLPVLERLGIVQSAELPVPAPQDSAPTKRYSLTTKGQQYYLQKKHTTLDLHSQPEEHDADFCVAQLRLDKVVRWDPPVLQNGHMETVVRYTYHIKAADWMSDPEAQKVLPVVNRIIRGEGKLLMSATAQMQDNGRWLPVLPGQ